MSDYKICATNDLGRTLTISTSSRRNALRHVELFQTKSSYAEITVEHRGQQYIGDQIKEMP